MESFYCHYDLFVNNYKGLLRTVLALTDHSNIIFIVLCAYIERNIYTQHMLCIYHFVSKGLITNFSSETLLSKDNKYPSLIEFNPFGRTLIGICLINPLLIASATTG